MSFEYKLQMSDMSLQQEAIDFLSRQPTYRTATIVYYPGELWLAEQGADGWDAIVYPRDYGFFIAIHKFAPKVMNTLRTWQRYINERASCRLIDSDTDEETSW
jgi:hypothetical protein